MSRFQRAVRGVAASYVLLVSTAVYSLASVPVALHYLDAEHFGLWVVMGTLVNYLNLIDVGMTGAAARLLIDYKDDRNGGHYGSLLLTGWLVASVQGLIILGTGLGLAGLFAKALHIGTALQPEFIRLVGWQCAGVALIFGTRMLGLVLDAHQRMDIANYIGSAGLLVNFASQWAFFHWGYGVLSLAFGALAANICAVAAQGTACARLQLLPQAGHWGRVSWRHFLELFSYGKDVFLVAVGTQLIMASQPIIITRILGVEAAATWGVGLRMFNLLNRAVWRIYDMSQSAFAEMLARRELARLSKRYHDIAVTSFAIAAWAAVSFALCNHLFITIWTHGKIHWPAINDMLLAIWMLLFAIIHCHNSFIVLTKKVLFMRYIYFLEGTVFVGLAIWVAKLGGLPAVITCSICCTTVFSFAYGIRRISRFFELPISTVGLGWLLPAGRILVIYLPLAGVLGWTLSSAAIWVQLLFHFVITVPCGFLLLLRFGLPASLQNELLARIPSKYTFLLRQLFGKT